MTQYGYKLAEIKDIEFRTKDKFQVKQERNPIGVSGTVDKYFIAFLHGISYTENCYRCAYARQERVSDITLGDSWESDLPLSMQKKGVSLILCQSKKGEELLEKADSYRQEADRGKATKSNRQLKSPSKKPRMRKLFFEKSDAGVPFNRIVVRCYLYTCLKQLVKAFLIKGNGSIRRR